MGREETMSRSWVLAIALLGSVAVTASLFDTAATAGPPVYSPKASEVPQLRPAKACAPVSWSQQECVNGNRGWCYYYLGTNCRTTKTCKVVRPAPRC